MEKRVILAITISAAILLGYNMMAYKKVEHSPQTLSQQVTALPQPSSLSLVPKPTTDKRAGLNVSEEDLCFKTEVMSVKLNPWGEIAGLQLLKIIEHDKSPVELALPPVHTEADYPLSVYLGTESLTPKGFSCIDQYTREINYGVETMPGAAITKRYKLIPGTYLMEVEISIKNLSDTTLKNDMIMFWESPCKTAQENDIKKAQLKHSHLTILEQDAQVNGKVEKIGHHQAGALQGILSFLGFISPATPTDSVIKKKDVSWIAQSSQYFLNILIPEKPSDVIFVKTMDDRMKLGCSTPIALSPGEEKIIKTRVYAGPRDYTVLKSLSGEMTNLTAFSGWNSLTLIVLWLLHMLYKITHNYGISIIILTLIIKIILHPLTKKNFTTMKAMQNIQPHIIELKEKHKHDAETMNKEMMELYKRHKVNPMGGCLPLLLQMPVFIALFTTLQNAIELRGANFLIWHDLATKDPYYILPVLMGVTMLIQQKMMPSPDPNQAKIGMFMSVLFIFMFMNFPAGLVLYWLTQNILTIIEQILIKRGIEK
ncbi:membrane protein insertase YidC [bacterium]|nr:membrane protein insertase YidC [bacterium]MBU1753126.1 membrane protein insertase YidC [bacterium]